jgi:hypothetical protein
MRVVDVPGNHVEMFREPNVAVMAEALNTALQEADSERELIGQKGKMCDRWISMRN